MNYPGWVVQTRATRECGCGRMAVPSSSPFGLPASRTTGRNAGPTKWALRTVWSLMTSTATCGVIPHAPWNKYPSVNSGKIKCVHWIRNKILSNLEQFIIAASSSMNVCTHKKKSYLGIDLCVHDWRAECRLITIAWYFWTVPTIPI